MFACGESQNKHLEAMKKNAKYLYTLISMLGHVRTRMQGI